MDEIDTQPEVTNQIPAVIDTVADEPTTEATKAKWYVMNTQKKRVAAGVGAGVLAFGVGFGAAAMFTGEDHGDRGHHGVRMQQWMDGQQMPHGQMPMQRGDQQWQQQGGQQWGQHMPQQGQMPSMGPNSGGPSRSNGS